jgi:hypothetical protein
MIDPPTRGEWHRRTPRGWSPPQVGGAGQLFPCAFCDKTFRIPTAARRHERHFHTKLLAQAIEQYAPERAVPDRPLAAALALRLRAKRLEPADAHDPHGGPLG